VSVAGPLIRGLRGGEMLRVFRGRRLRRVRRAHCAGLFVSLRVALVVGGGLSRLMGRLGAVMVVRLLGLRLGLGVRRGMHVVGLLPMRSRRLMALLLLLLLLLGVRRRRQRLVMD
jgi:hypothetical protein